MEFKNWLQSFDAVVVSEQDNNSVIELLKNEIQTKNPVLFEKWKSADFDINFGFHSYNLLYVCSGLGLKSLVEGLVRAGADIRTHGSKSPLMIAAKKGHNDIVRFLLNHGAQVSEHSLGKTPLHLAAAEGHNEVVNTLIQHKANIDATDINKDTPLKLSLRNNHYETVKTLIEAGAPYTDDIIHLAAHYCHLNIIKYLVEQRNINVHEVDAQGMTTLHYAVINGDIKIIKYLIELKMDPKRTNETGFDVVHCAAKHGKLDAFKYFIEELKLAFNVFNKHKFEEWTPLFYAAVEGYLDIVKYLIEEKKVDINTKNSKGHFALYLVTLHYCHIDMIKYFVGKGANINYAIDSKKTVLHGAAWNGNMEVIKYYLNAGFKDVYARDENNIDCLGKAVMRGELEAAKFFIKELKFDINVLSKDKKNLLHFAVWSKNLKMIDYILNLKHSFIGETNFFNQTPLLFAIKQGDIDIVTFLLENGADINVQDSYCNTPLHRAVFFKQFPMVIHLIKYVPDIFIKDQNNNTPFQLLPKDEFEFVLELAAKDDQRTDILEFLNNIFFKYNEGYVKDTSIEPTKKHNWRNISSNNNVGNVKNTYVKPTTSNWRSNRN